jgi:hypothetical protein
MLCHNSMHNSMYYVLAHNIDTILHNIQATKNNKNGDTVRHLNLKCRSGRNVHTYSMLCM